MEDEKTIKIFAKVKADWPRQPVDDAIMSEWVECLRRVSHAGALEAVRTIRDTGQAAPPTCGAVYVLARQIDVRIASARRASIRALPPAKPSAEEMARVRELFSKVGVRIKGTK